MLVNKKAKISNLGLFVWIYLSVMRNSTYLANYYTQMCAKFCNFAVFFIEYKRPRHKLIDKSVYDEKNLFFDVSGSDEPYHDGRRE